MDPITAMAFASAAAPTISGLLGGNKAGKADKEAQRIRDRAAQQIYGIEVPDVEDLQYQLEQNKYAGDLDPQMLNNLGDIESEYGNISADPRFQTAQYQSLGGLDDIINSGGMTLNDKLLSDNAMRAATTQSSREQGAITRELAERGLAGSGQELAMRLAAQQNSANTQAQAAQQTAANAQQRALDAMMQRGNMAGNMQSASYEQQNKAASAKDLIKQFNINNAYDVQGRNADISNAGQERNLNSRQAFTDGNTAIRNGNVVSNTGAIQQTFDNKLDKGAAAMGAATGQAASRTNQANQIRDEYAGYGQAAASGADAYAKLNAPAPKKKQAFAGQSYDGKTYG